MLELHDKPAASPRRSAGDAREFLATCGLSSAAQGGGTKYLALVEAIEAGIQTGALVAGTQLPAQREIAGFFRTTVATVTKAIGEATRRGLVVARAGSGTYVAPTGGAAGQAGSGLVDLSLNVPPIAATADIVSAALRRVSQGDASSLFDYAPVAGQPANRQAGADLLALRGVSADAEQVTVTQGAHQGLITALMAVTRPGDVVACERLNYTGLRRIAELLQLRLAGVDTDADGMLAQPLADLLRGGGVKAIVCTPTCHNPTSVTMPARRRGELVKVARAAGVPIVEDDIYGLLCGDGLAPLVALWPEGVLHVTSLSKCVAPGLRIGYVRAPAQLAPRVRDVTLALGWTEPALQAALATELVQSGDAQRCAELHRAEARRRVALAHQVLGEGVATAHQAASYHLWVSTSGARPGEVTAELSRRGILVSSGSHFVVDDSASPHALRISLGGGTSVDRLHGALREIAAVLAGGRARSLGSIV
ncbi:MAG TPA: PLP-dependent aminotransferase family protein [Ramlibacter sp.]|nr:PLP-dependent aminotransferase family protein [Ramlibacter sp.]